MADIQPRQGKAGPAAIALTVAMLTVSEGFVSIARHERVDPPGIITVCFGMTNYDKKDLKAGDKYSKADCQKFLAEAVPRYDQCIQQTVNANVVIPDHRRAALISWIYNLGCGNFKKSGIARYLNAGNVSAACDAMLPYVRANGVVLPGLVRRRHEEAAFCRRED